VCEAAGTFPRFGKLFVLAAGALFVGSEEARCALISRCCCYASRQRRRKAEHFLQVADGKDFLHKQGVFRKEGKTFLWGIYVFGSIYRVVRDAYIIQPEAATSGG
jgi:hypothetical protein